MSNKIKLITIIVALTVFGISFASRIGGASDISISESDSYISSEFKKTIYKEKHIMDEESRLEEKNGSGYASHIKRISDDDIAYIFERAEEIEINPYVILGLIELESKFNRYAVGAKGERGLGQLMANTAKPVAYNLGIEYNPDKLFEPQYNILIFTTQLKYLYNFYNKDIHKTLTAYNRGQFGLEKYIASRSNRSNPAISDYSLLVMENAKNIKVEFDNN